MKKNCLVIGVSCGALLLCLCFNGVPKKDRLAYVGSSLITQKDVDAFSIVSRYYPNPPEEYSLVSRPSVSAQVEVAAIYRKMRWNLANIKFRHSLEWRWRERYYVAYLFMENILKANYGYTDNELRKYFDGHRKDYMQEIPGDSSKKIPATKVVRPFSECKHEIAEKIFLKDHKPDLAFKRSHQINDTVELAKEWLRYVDNQGFRDLFLNWYFKDKYGKALPDSLKDIYGKGKPVSPEDMALLLSWVPASRREEIKNNPQALKDLSLWLLRWKLYSEKAASTGYTSQPLVRETLKWAWRFEIAQRYITDKLAPLAKKNIHIDSAMAVYSYWDANQMPGPGAAIDTGAWKNNMSQLVSREINTKFDSLMFEIRRSERVRFLTDWRDDKVKNPTELARRADSLRDTGNTNEAQGIYQTLVDNYCFTKEGKRALVELAKIRTEQQSYNEAINDYRRYLIIDGDKSKECNTMFMIGFIYDEYLDKPELAEANYKWVLKNAPGCELADDAEFMMLHLGEQMASVDELQAEVKRQGKKVEASDTDTTGLKVEMAPAQKKKI